jgi:FtsZ-binding cell division protein ZapB
MSESDDDVPTQSYWPSVTDLFLTLFIIAIAIVAVVFCALLPTNNVGKDRALVIAVGNDLRHVREPMNRLRTTLDLEPVESNARPSAVISALSETCDTAVTKIRLLQDRLDRLKGSNDLKAEVERLLKENDVLKQQLQKLQLDYDELLRTLGGDPELLKKLIKEIDDLRRQLHDKPPNIQFSESEEGKKTYRFDSGSSVMNPDFIEGLRQNEFAQLAGEIIGREEEGRVKVDTLEIIGHTDGAPLSSDGNLDQKLPDVLAGPLAKISSLTPGSNNDLGLLRALAVREQWEQFIDSHAQVDILRKIQIRCYSAGQTILPFAKVEPGAGDFRKPDARARRIEMRLTRLLEQGAPPQPKAE